MKLLTSLLFLFFIFSNAQAFLVSAQCNFNPSHGECRVLNDTQNLINCKLTIFGQTSRGYSFNGFEFATLYPGQFAYAYVNANNPMLDPLVIVNGSAECRQLN